MNKIDIIINKDNNFTEKPQINFFKYVYKKYYYFVKSNYNSKHILNFNSCNTIQIAKLNYLINKISLKITLPKLTSKSGNFSYIPYISYYIFEYIEFLIDGTVIDKLSDNYIYIYNEIFLKSSRNVYPYNNEKLLLETNNKNNIILFLDLPFYFCINNGLSFPLFSCLNSKIELRFKIRDLKELIIYDKDISFNSKLNIDIIYDIICVDNELKKKYFSKCFEYLIIQKNYILNLSVLNNLEEQKIYIQFKNMIIDIYFYLQNQNNIDLKQYFNYTKYPIIPRLDMNISNKIKYIKQINKYISNESINNLFVSISNKEDNIYRLLSNLNYQKYNNIKYLLSKYYLNLSNQLIEFKTNLYFNSVERFSLNYKETNFLIPYEKYNGIILGLNVYSFALYPLEYQPSGFVNFNYLESNFSITLLNSTIKELLNLNFIIRNYNILKFHNGIANLVIK